MPETARRLLASGEPPPARERIAMRAQRSLQTWVAWIEDPRAWFVVAEMATAPGGYRQALAIRVCFYDEDGRFLTWDTWAINTERCWTLREQRRSLIPFSR